MIFTEINLKGAFIIEPEKKEDHRGFFARTWDKQIFEEINLNSDLVQCGISVNRRKGTLRGMHYQIEPFQEVKLVRCTKGSIYDVIVDIREDSKTYNQWFSIILSSTNYKMLYVPVGFAHGFQTLENDSEVFYQMSEKFMPEFAGGRRWNDKEFAIKWPILPPILSEKDAV